MSATVRKFVERAPRYTLQPTDNRMMRFAHNDEQGQSHVTKIVDLSYSGLSFVVDRDNSPFIFETIKVEVPIPGGERMAWWGKVVRMEEYSDHKWYLNQTDFRGDDQILVGVRFEDMPEAQTLKLKRALEHKFAEIEAEKKRRALNSMVGLWKHFSWELVTYAGVVLTALLILWALSRPTDNYDADKGSPWGRRMWFWDAK